VRRLVDFYAGAVWPGVMSANSDEYPTSTRFAIPLPDKVDMNLRAAIDQLFLWSNFSAQRYAVLRYGAALGNVMIEIIDDVETGKVVFDVLWPGLVTDLSLDYGGHVKKYAVEYNFVDREDDKEYTYRREVDRDTIRTYRDDNPFSYNGVPAVYDNPYGFSPAVWISHTHLGGLYGSPAVRNITKLDELNSIVSHVNDQINKILAAPVILAMHSPDATIPESKAEEITLGGVASRESIDYIEASIGARVETMNLPQGQAFDHIRLLLDEIERDTPELSVWTKVQDKVQVSGIAVEYLVADAQAYVSEAQQNYDTGLIRALQMAISIAGMRQSEASNGWSEGTYEQQRFAAYDLDSYKQGDLHFIILPRPLIQPTQTQATQLRILNAQADRIETELTSPQTEEQTPAAAIDSPNYSQGINGRLARLGLSNGNAAATSSISK
jgi:hypothetical protein